MHSDAGSDEVGGDGRLKIGKCKYEIGLKCNDLRNIR
jgi:hypothetical protein